MLEVNLSVSNCMMAYIANKQKSLVLMLFCPNSHEIGWLRLVCFLFPNLALHLCVSLFLEASSQQFHAMDFLGTFRLR